MGGGDRFICTVRYFRDMIMAHVGRCINHAHNFHRK